MSSPSPTKRRKGDFTSSKIPPTEFDPIDAAMKQSVVVPVASDLTGGIVASSREPGTSRWPKARLPVELFTLIISHISRADIQNMRLVCKEFEEKVSQTLFKTVVVPFNPEIYGIREDPDPLPDPLSNIPVAQIKGQDDVQDDRIRGGGGVMLQDKGMRVFQGFGKHILKFAMSFELEQQDLMNPPQKSDQEAITTFWGIYRWPFKTYNRYSQLEGLEQTADETRTMADALQYITKATDLGLSIDCGLGWMSGPDTNGWVNPNRKPPVFGESTPAEPPNKKPNTQFFPTYVEDQTNHDLVSFQRMLMEAGYEGEELDRSLTTLLLTEGITPPSSSQSYMAISLPQSLPSTLNNEPSPDRRRELAESMLRTFGYTPAAVEAIRNFLQRHDNILPRAEVEETQSVRDTINVCVKLKPKELTTPQKEMLLEIEWAQRAFMHSYAIAIIDNRFTFTTVERLTIARLPGRFLSILQRSDFWDSLPNVSKLTLAVIPDWRDVTKLASTYVQDVRLLPSHAVEQVYGFLREQISGRRNIKELCFEWLCGGEEAVGLFARNQHVLPAPIVPKALDMAPTIKHDLILDLPHVESLTLKNCWANPNVFTSFVAALKQHAIKTLVLNSVSLTDVPFEPPTEEPVGPAHLGPQTPGSWPFVIDLITPGETIQMKRYKLDLGPKPPPQPPTNLERITFNSCGYINLPADFEHRHLPPVNNDPSPEAAMIQKRRADIDGYMMKPLDPTLGTILNHMPAPEASTLMNAWYLHTGWNDPSPALISQAKHDGIAAPGEGRFWGTLEASDDSSNTN